MNQAPGKYCLLFSYLFAGDDGIRFYCPDIIINAKDGCNAVFWWIGLGDLFTLCLQVTDTWAGHGGQMAYSATDLYNSTHNRNTDTELINMGQASHLVRYKASPFDWFICSVLGYLCCPCTGICAMYYAIRANHAVDWERDSELIGKHTQKAKCLTLTSIGLGVAMIVIMIILIVVMMNQVSSYRPPGY